MFDHPAFDGHERVVMHWDRNSGLKAVIALHDTRLGPAAGGCRRWRYGSADEALGDALRLSRGMSYKNALAGLPLGGGKAVILADGPASRDQWLRFAELVDSLGGRYVTAEDVGSTPTDMAVVAERTPFVSGVGHDPSPMTARGVFAGMRKAAETVWGSGLDGRRVAVQGLGNVGSRLCALLVEAGAVLVVADIDARRCDEARRRWGAEVVAVPDITRVHADVFSPCAMGGVVGPQEAAQLSCRVIAGAANNQLVDARVGRMLMDRGVVYAPDYVINAGGIIQVAAEYLGYDATWVDARIARIGPLLEEILCSAQAADVPPGEVADRMAADILRRGSALSTFQSGAHDAAAKVAGYAR